MSKVIEQLLDKTLELSSGVEETKTMMTYLSDSFTQEQFEEFIREFCTVEIATNVIISNGGSILDEMDLSAIELSTLIGIHFDAAYGPSEAVNTLPYLVCMEYPEAASLMLTEMQYWKDKGQIT